MLIEERTEVFTVAQLNTLSRQLLEEHFPHIWVEGEISNLATPASGHIYFSLKDADAQVRCAMFRGNNRRLNFRPTDGIKVLVQAKVSLYAPRGDYQLIVSNMEDAGLGALQREFEKLKQKLAKEGLFAETHKQPLPEFVRTLGVVTSATGAAIRDILSVLRRRAPHIHVKIFPTLVQGDKAASNIVRMIELANQLNTCDVLLVSRGGGSLEDLWPFNEEIVARAIFASQIPIVSGVGHEIDFTISDFVADVRAPTPSAAAELISTDQKHYLQRLLNYLRSMDKAILSILRHYRERITSLQKRLRHPKQLLRERMQKVDYLSNQLYKAIERQMTHYAHRIKIIATRLHQLSPAKLVQIHKLKLTSLQQKFKHAMLDTLKTKKHHFLQLTRSLDTISPLATLHRGYSITTTESGKIISTINDVQPRTMIKTILADGELISQLLPDTLNVD